MKKKLYVLVGLPMSGKTSWAQKHGAPMVCPDEIRIHALHGTRFVSEAEGYIWYLARIMVRSLFTAGHNEVILDASSVNVKRRGYWLNEDWETVFVVFPADEETCIERASSLKDDYTVSLITRMAASWEGLTREEAFSAIEPEDQFLEKV